jgi:hypothetical protein
MLKMICGSVTRQPLLAFVLLYSIVCLACALLLFNFSANEGDYTQGSFVAFSMFEVGTILFMVPILAVNRMDSMFRGNAISQFLVAQENSLKLVWSLLRGPLLIAGLFCLIPALLGFILRNYFYSLPFAIIFRAFVVALSIALLALAVGFYASVRCKNALSSAGLALLIILLLSTEPIWLGPVISAAANVPPIISLSLFLNPFIGAASALNFDILRIDPFYQICPIGQLRFQYPDYWAAALFNVLIALYVFWRFMIGIRRLLAPST